MYKQSLIHPLIITISLVLFTTLTIKAQSLEVNNLVLTRISMYDEEGQEIKNQTSQWINQPTIEITGKRRFLELSFHYQGTLPVSYAYKLGTSKSSWVNLGTKNTITFHSLPKGTHQLWIQAQTPQKSYIISKIIHNQKGIQVAHILLIGLFVCMLIVISLLIYKRHQYLVQKQALRIKIASDLHDEIGSTLTRISLGVDLLAADVLPPSERSQTLEEVSELGRNVTSIINDVIWFEDDGKSKLKFLVDKMREEAKLQLNPLGIQYDFHLQHPNYEAELPNSHRRSIYLIFKEALHNIVKHSGANHVNVHFIKDNQSYLLMVQDNGQFSTKRGKTGQGLSNMQLRANRVKGELNITWENGCSIQLYVPLIQSSSSKSRGILMK